MIKHLMLLNTQNIMDIKEVLHQWFTELMVNALCLLMNLLQVVPLKIC